MDQTTVGLAVHKENRMRPIQPDAGKETDSFYIEDDKPSPLPYGGIIHNRFQGTDASSVDLSNKRPQRYLIV